MAAQVQTGMEKADMRKMLMHTKEAPVHCAIGLGKDVSVGLLVMDKLKQGKMLEKHLIDSLPDAKNTRFGRAEVNWSDDPKLVKLFLNRPISGMARKLVKTLKGTGFSKVQIMTEDGTPVEGAADEEEDAQAGAAAPVEAAPAAAAPGEAPPPPPPPPPQADQAPSKDPAELSRRLAALIPRIAQAAGGDEARKAELSKLASMGNVNIKTNNLVYAANYIGQLEKALGGPAPDGNGAVPPPPPPPPPAPAAEAKPSADDLAKQLAALIPRIPGAAGEDAARRAALMKFATDANVNIKTGNPTYAAVAIEQLRRAIEGAGAPAAPAPAAPAMDAEAMRNFLMRLTLRMPEAAGHNDAKLTQWQGMGAEVSKLLDAGDMAGAGAALGRLRDAMAADMQKAQEAAKQAKTYDKSGQIWAATRQKVEGELGRLRAAIVDSYKGESFAGEIGAKFDARTAPVLATLDLKLADKLAEVGKTSDPKQVSALSDEAHTLIDGYRKFAGDALLADLDSNPFLPVAVQATVMGTLTQLEKALP